MNYVSLGFICAIARDLEKLGLRNSSMPFDWCLTDFQGIIKAINNNFEGYLTYNRLLQEKKCLKHYKNVDYNVQFYHDFNRFESLDKQLPSVKAKYDRRIKRFYETIKEPTIFVRYISDDYKIDGKSTELIWIEENYDYIISSLKSFNPNNDIIFIANEGVISNKISIYNVRKDKGDRITRSPIINNINSELRSLFENKVDTSNRNAIRWERKKIRLRKLIKNLFSLKYLKKQLQFGFYRVIKKNYNHPHQY